MSGARPPAAPEGVPFLAKPFDLDELLALVTAALQLPG
jgi:DNA-binding response OmpR family regulator